MTIFKSNGAIKVPTTETEQNLCHNKHPQDSKINLRYLLLVLRGKVWVSGIVDYCRKQESA